MKRTITRELLEWKSGRKRKPLLLRGARQVGKTYTLREFGRNEFTHYHYLNFEEDDRLWHNVTYQLARSQDGSALRFRFKDAVPGLRGYERLAGPLRWLEMARLVLRTSIVSRAEPPPFWFFTRKSV